jgi:hypothetical protein
MRFLDTAVQLLTCINLLLTMATNGISLRGDRRKKKDETQKPDTGE